MNLLFTYESRGILKTPEVIYQNYFEIENWVAESEEMYSIEIPLNTT